VNKKKEEPALLEYRNYVLSLVVWSFVELMILIDAPPGILLWNGLRETLGIAAAVTFIVFLGVYTQSNILQNERFITLMWVYASVGSFASLTAPILHIFPAANTDLYQGYVVVGRPFEGVWVAYTLGVLLLLVFSYGILLRFMFYTTNIYRKQTGIIFIGILGLTVGTFMQVFGFGPHIYLNTGLIFFAPLGILIGFSIYYYDFLKVVPFAQDKVIETVEDPIVILDQNDRIAFMNEAAENFGLIEDDLGESIDDLVSGIVSTLDDDSTNIFEYNSDLRSDGGCSQVARRSKWYKLSETIIFDKYDNKRGRAVVCSDITEQKRREQRLDQFASMVSHDLRSPLNTASGHLELAQMNEDLSRLDDIRESHDRIEEIIEELLLLARHGFDDFDPESVCLATMANSAWDQISTEMSSLSIDDLGGEVEADPHQVQELFENLFRNAIEHNDGGVNIHVGSLEDGFFVADDGKDIPAEKRAEVLEAGVTENESGTGLGLHIVTEFANAHGWDVRVTESDSGGSQFEFTSVSKYDQSN